MSQSREDAYTGNPHEWNDSGYLIELTDEKRAGK